jgi:hypothetical protein
MADEAHAVTPVPERRGGERLPTVVLALVLARQRADDRRGRERHAVDEEAVAGVCGICGSALAEQQLADERDLVAVPGCLGIEAIVVLLRGSGDLQGAVDVDLDDVLLGPVWKSIENLIV